jgi:uncharacterized protein YbjQ (UPF0145 family)
MIQFQTRISAGRCASEQERTTTMKTMRKTTTIAVLALCLLACGLLAGCATADFTPYSGAQQNWPVATGGFVDTKYAVPVFYGTPNRPYNVIGYLKAETDAYRNTRDQVIGFMARRARELGGNGLILVGTSSHYMGSVTSVYGNVYGSGFSATGTSIGLFGGNGDAVVIRLG